jgi:hypothetical protein
MRNMMAGAKWGGIPRDPRPPRRRALAGFAVETEVLWFAEFLSRRVLKRETQLLEIVLVLRGGETCEAETFLGVTHRAPPSASTCSIPVRAFPIFAWRRVLPFSFTMVKATVMYLSAILQASAK